MIDRPVERVAIAGLALTALAAVNAVGWDQHGPLRWLVLPTIGFALTARAVGRGQVVPGPEDRLGRLAMLAWAGLLGWGALAAALGADPLHAWIGTPDRRFGWLTWLLCGGLFVVGRSLTPGGVTALTRAMTVGAVVLGLHTGAQWVGLLDDGGFAGGRLGGPLGQPAYLGAGAVLAVPVAVGTALDRSSPSGWRYAGAGGAIVSTAALLLSQSRAAWLGLLVAVILAAVLRRGAGPESGADHTTVPSSGRWAAGLVVASLVVVAVVPALRARIVDAGEGGGVIDGRLAEWGVGLRALGHSPLVGHGPEGYRTVFGANVDAAYVVDWGRDVITDRAHNGLLDIALAFGVPGALSAVVLLGSVLVGAVSILRRSADGTQVTIVGLAVAVVGYLAAQQLLFPLSELDPLLWLAAGVVTAAAAPPPRADPEPVAPGLATSIAGGLLAGLAAVTGLAGLADLGADRITASALDDDTADATDLDGATRLRPDSIRYRFLASRLSSRRGDLDRALTEIEAGLDRSPTDPALRGERAALLLEMARSLPDASPERGPAIDRALTELESLVADDPLHPRHLQRLGVALALAGRVEEARGHLELAVDLAPDDPTAATNLQLVEQLADGSSQGPIVPGDDG